MAENEDINSLISNIEKSKLFSGIPEEELIKLVPYFEKIIIKPGQILFSQGDASDYLYILTKGSLVSHLVKSSGQTELIGLINPFETIGEVGCMSGEPRSLTVEALTDCEVIRLPSTIFLSLLTPYPIILSAISNLIIKRSIQTIKLIGKEKPKHNLSIIFPLSKQVPYEVFYDAHLGEMFEKNNTIFIKETDNSVEHLHKLLHQHDIKYKKILLLLDIISEEFILHFRDKLFTIYMVISEEERIVPLDKIQKVVQSIKLFSHIRLELILIHTENIGKIINTQKWLELARFNLHHHVRLNNKADYERLNRFMSGTATAVVLGGGGAKGLAHLGVLKAILDKNITIDAIGGTSIGAIIAASFASTLSYPHTVGFTNQLKKASIQSLTWHNLTWPIISLYSSNPATKTLNYIFKDLYIEDLFLPYFAVSSNLSKKSENIHTRGILWEALRSTSAIPGIFPPMAKNGQLFMDGGLLNNLPVDVMRKFIGPGHLIIACSLARIKNDKDFYHFPPVVMLSDAILRKFRKKDYHFPPLMQTFLEAMLLGSSSKEIKNSIRADILVKPNLTGYKTLSTIEKKEQELIRMGYEETSLAIETYIKNKETQKSKK